MWTSLVGFFLDWLQKPRWLYELQGPFSEHTHR
jgi:hypothetical protein